MRKDLPKLEEGNREWWEKFAAINPVSRQVAAFLLGRSPNYVTAVARAMGASGNCLHMDAVRKFLRQHPSFSVRSAGPTAARNNRQGQPA